MELKYLNTFKAIIENGSFTAAAEKLNYTQSTITFQIGQLENELSVNLFEKIGRKMILTKAGERLVPYVDEVLEAIDKLHNAQEDLSQCQGSLKIGIAETLLCYRMPEILGKFNKKAPQAQLFLRSMNCYEIRNELIAGTLDMGVFYEDVGGFGSNLAVYPFGNYPLELVASPEIKKSYPDFITPDRKIPIPFIINEPNCIFRQIFEEYLKNKSIILDHTIELWSIPTIKNLVKNSVGVSYLPRFAVQNELDGGELEIIETEVQKPAISAICAHHKNKWVSPLMQLFIDICKENQS